MFWFRRFSAMRLWLRVALVTSLPMVGLLALTGSATLEQWHLFDEMESLRQLSRLSGRAGGLVHELQKERGFSSGFASSSGDAFGGALAAQRQETDDALLRFQAEATRAATVRHAGRFAPPLAEISTRLAELERIRAQVDAGRTGFEELLGHYTSTIEQVIALVGVLDTPASGTEVQRSIFAYESLLWAKEHAGQERAIGTVGFVRDHFTGDLAKRFLALDVAQEGFLERFRHAATREQLTFCVNLMRGPVLLEVERLRTAAIDSAVSGESPGVDATHWWKVSSARIGLLARVEDRLHTDLAMLAARRADQARWLLLLHAVGLLAALVATLVVAWAILRDLEARRHSAEIMQAHEHLLDNFVRAATDGFALFDANLNLVEINQASIKLIPAGRTREDFIGKNILELNPSARGTDRHRAYLRVLETGEPYVMDDVSLPPNLGGTRLSVKVFKVGSGLGMIHTDVTVQKEKEEHLRILATTDPLTGAVNRRRFFEIGTEELQRALRHGRELSLISLDIDHFKNLNDSYGHHAGDQALKLLTETSRGLVRAYDTFGRLGGEEFSILLPETPQAVAVTTAERLRTAFSDMRIPTPTGMTQLTVSFGVAALEPGDAVLDDLLQRADRALYRAKDDGRDRVRSSLQAPGFTQ